MTRIRRGLLLLGLIVTVVVTGTGAAQASLADSASVSAGTIGTATVAPPAAGPGSLACGRTAATMALTWTQSTSTRVTGYLVTVYFSDGFVQTVQMLATDTGWSKPIALYNVTAYAVQYSVTTQTDYRWTAESARTAWFQC